MKVIVFGSNGMLGKYVCYFFEKKNSLSLKTYSRKDFDIFKEYKNKNLHKTIYNILLDQCPDFIVNCSGITNKRDKISHEEMFVVNSLFPKLLTDTIKNNNFDIKLIQISTDCVFSEDKGENTNSCFYDNGNMYGSTKLLGEVDHCMVLRTSIIGKGGIGNKSLINWLLSKEPHSTVYGYINHRWNGVTCWKLAEIIYLIITDKIKYIEGKYNIISKNEKKQFTTKFDLINIINYIYNLRLNVIATDDMTENCYRDLKLTQQKEFEIHKMTGEDLKKQIQDQRYIDTEYSHRIYI